MTDVVDRKTRSRMMAGIRGKDTKPELVLRKALHKRGFRYRLHWKDLPGKPDLVFTSRKAVIFVNGCFWHGHIGCAHFKWPKSNTDFWKDKITQTQVRDSVNYDKLVSEGWSLLVVWECAIDKTQSTSASPLTDTVEAWLRSDHRKNKEITGSQGGKGCRFKTNTITRPPTT